MVLPVYRGYCINIYLDEQYNIVVKMLTGEKTDGKLSTKSFFEVFNNHIPQKHKGFYIPKWILCKVSGLVHPKAIYYKKQNHWKMNSKAGRYKRSVRAKK